MKKSILYFVAAIAATAAHAVTTTLEYEDFREAESRASVSNEIFRAAQSATNYTDSVAASLGALAWVDSVDWADILGRPTTWDWSAISSKPTTLEGYGITDAISRSANTLTTPGVYTEYLINSYLQGGVRIRYSSTSDANQTTYMYAGVAVRRNGVNTDYLFDTSSQSGIVRRSELAGVTPGDYATVSNKAMTALQSYTETDPNVPSWAKASSKPSYSASEVGAAPSSLTSAVSSLSNNVVTVSNLIAAVAHEWTATNTVAVIARHTGKETVSIPSGGNLVANLSGWNDGVQTFVVLQPSGAYTVASNVEYCGYGTWPTNTALCVAWPYAGTLYVNPIIVIQE